MVQPFETSYDADYNYLAIKSKFSQDKRYRLEVLPNAVTDFLDNTNKDTLSFNFETLKEESYGILNLTFDNLDKEESYILQLLQENTVVYEKILDRDSIPKKLKIIDLLPGDYQLRVIHDLNRNSRIDMGSFIGQIQPEPVYYIPSPITVRANWEVDQLVHIGGEDKKQHSF